MIEGQGEMQVTPEGAKRESNEGRGRFDLLPYEAMEALTKWYEDGAKKYGDRNWEKGLSVKDCINRMIRHSIKAGNGWTDEDHLSAVMWNAAAAITMMQRKPECNDHPWQEILVKEEFVYEVNYGKRVAGINPHIATINESTLDGLCNSMNAHQGLARHRYVETQNEDERDLVELLHQATRAIRSIQENKIHSHE